MSEQNGVIQLGMTNPVPDGLSLEYKRNYGTARRNLHLSDFLNHAAVQGEVGVFSLGLPKEFFNRLAVELGSTTQNLPNSVLIGPNTT